jgi:hypothetical protein
MPNRQQFVLSPILFKSLLLAIVLLCFHVIESLIEGVWCGRTVIESIPRFGGGVIEGIFSVGVIACVGLFPFFAPRDESAIGER